MEILATGIGIAAAIVCIAVHPPSFIRKLLIDNSSDEGHSSVVSFTTRR